MFIVLAKITSLFLEDKISIKFVVKIPSEKDWQTVPSESSWDFSYEFKSEIVAHISTVKIFIWVLLTVDQLSGAVIVWAI